MDENVLLEKVNAALASKGERIHRRADGSYYLSDGFGVIAEGIDLLEVARDDLGVINVNQGGMA